jgi:hypothetical protein
MLFLAVQEASGGFSGLETAAGENRGERAARTEFLGQEPGGGDAVRPRLERDRSALFCELRVFGLDPDPVDQVRAREEARQC